LVDWVTDNGDGANVADLAPDLLARFFSDDAAKRSCRGGPKKAVSLNAMRTSIRCFCAHLRDAGLVSANPARLLRRARCAPPPPKALHADEQKRLLEVLAAATGPEAERDRMLVECSALFKPSSIERVLRHLGLRYRPPGRAPPRAVQAGLPLG
jgi:site-specific recombinase XerC